MRRRAPTKSGLHPVLETWHTAGSPNHSEAFVDKQTVIDQTHQGWNPDQYARNARFVAELGMPVVALLAPVAGEQILDLGCGDGALTRVLADLGCQVVGVDASAAMIDAACALGLDARVMDGRELGFDATFDAVFSNAALHWMREPEKVFAGVWRALKPGGRFVAELGGHGNIATITAALDRALAKRGIDGRSLNPWLFPSLEECRQRLTAAGFAIESIDSFLRPTPLPGCASGWLETFAQSFISAVPAVEREDFVAEVVELCRPQLCDAAGRWTADYVRLRFRAIKPC